MRPLVWREAICLFLAVLMSMNSAGAITDNSLQGLNDLLTNNEDDRMTVQDLAFLLITHNFDAEPGDEFVTVRIEGSVYRLRPNGSVPGLADILQE